MELAKAKITVRIAELQKRLAAYRKYQEACTAAEDWHGVSDAANDIRCVESEIGALTWTLSQLAQEDKP